MILYAESSALLAWLLGQADGDRTGELLGASEGVITSQLTLVECDRVLHRAVAAGMPETAAATTRHHLERTTAHWAILTLGRNVVDRARRPFPAEPIRSLDALHLASALVARTEIPDLEILSLDGRIRASAGELGFDVLP